jgi:hypothetical protein
MFGQPSCWSARLYPRCGKPTGKDLGKRCVRDPLGLALSRPVQVLVARVFDPTIKSFGRASDGD